VRYLAIVTLTSAVLLEVVLQLGAVFVWLEHRDTGMAVPADGDRVVLCVGDSFTFGIGSSSSERRSYPAQLQELVREALGGRWRVVNAGVPGQSSREVLEDVANSLGQLAPALVYVLVGANDGWRQPQPLALARASGTAAWHGRSFRLCWRTALLARWALGNRFATADSAPRRIATLQQRLQHEPSEAHALQLLAALREEGDADGGRALALRLVDQFPDSGQVWRELAWQKFVAGDFAGGAAASALALLPPTETALGAQLLRARAMVLVATDPAAAAASAAAATQLDGRHLTKEVVRDLIDQVAPTTIDRVYEAHLRQIVELCRAADVTPILLSYPTRRPRLERSIQRVAQDSGAEWLDMATAFAQRIASRDPAEYFIVEDGHCNDAGYRVMAEVVFDDVRRRLVR
jgi:lysophospholipase L1-like esterase